jgi:uncharacterized coiled-coil protein SlyX
MRKKKYFEELEDRVKDLENQLIEKDTKIAELNQRIIIQEMNQDQPPKDMKAYKDNLIQDCLNLIENLPEDDYFLDKQQELNDKF